MSPQLTRRMLLALAGAQTAQMAMAGAIRAEGGPVPLLSFAARTPLRCGEAALRVRDLGAMEAYYTNVLGLEVIRRDDSGASLGVAGRPFLHLIARPDAPWEAAGTAGLYHIAWLMPSRPDLARWLVHAALLRVPLTGFADHLVSEAVYLNDPEGNGIEVYADRPESDWAWSAGQVAMATDPLDVDGLVALVPTDRETYAAAPAGLTIGHMHLRVGEIAAARAFYGTALGLDLTRMRDGSAAFLSSGGYHHHLGLNVWQSAGAGLREEGVTGLAWFSVVAEDAALLEATRGRLTGAGYAVTAMSGGYEIADPWGTRLRLTQA